MNRRLEFVDLGQGLELREHAWLHSPVMVIDSKIVPCWRRSIGVDGTVIEYLPGPIGKTALVDTPKEYGGDLPVQVSGAEYAQLVPSIDGVVSGQAYRELANSLSRQGVDIPQTESADSHSHSITASDSHSHAVTGNDEDRLDHSHSLTIGGSHSHDVTAGGGHNHDRGRLLFDGHMHDVGRIDTGGSNDSA